MAKTYLDNTVDVIDLLGGNGKVADMLGTTDKAVSNWRYGGFFPANTYVALQKALDKVKAEAPDELWAMKALLRKGKK